MVQARLRGYLPLLVLADAALALAAYLAAFWLRSSLALPGLPEVLPWSRFFEVSHLLPQMLAARLCLLYGLGLSDERLWTMGRGHMARLAALASGLTILLLVGYRYFTTPLGGTVEGGRLYFPRTVYLLFWGLDVVAILSIRLPLLAWVRRRFGAARAAIVGNSPAALELVDEVRRRPETGLRIVGAFDPELAQARGLPWLGSMERLVEAVREHGIAEIIIAGGLDAEAASPERARLLETLARGELTEARVSLIPGFYELLIGRIHRLQVHDIPLMEVLREPVSRPYRLVKRLFDLVLAGGLAVLTLPLWVGAAALIRLSEGGAVIFAQERCGEGRRPFRLYKFRTMAPDAEARTGPVLATKDDERVTRLGRVLRRYRIDELPQLWNVLRGEMSLVGPRPERPFFVEGFLREIPGYGERFKAKPGLTGLAQVRAGYETSARNKLRYDLAYIYNQSLGLDLSILVDTVKEVFNSKGH